MWSSSLFVDDDDDDDFCQSSGDQKNVEKEEHPNPTMETEVGNEDDNGVVRKEKGRCGILPSPSSFFFSFNALAAALSWNGWRSMLLMSSSAEVFAAAAAAAAVVVVGWVSLVDMMDMLRTVRAR